MRIKKQYKIMLEILLLILLIFFDQLTKYMATLYLKSQPANVLINNILELRYLENSGAAFGILQNKILFFSIITLLIIVFILYLKIKINSTIYDKKVDSKLGNKFIVLDIILLLLAAGAIGNLIDRVKFNYVIDFIYFKVIDFPVFNLADCYVSVSAIILIFLFLFVFKDNEYGILFPTKKQRL